MQYTTVVKNDKRTAFVIVDGHKYPINVDHIALKDALARAKFVAETIHECPEYVMPDTVETVPVGTQHLTEVLVRVANEREIAHNQ